MVKTYILPKFGDLMLGEIDKVMIQARLDALAASSYSKSTLRHIRGKLVDIFGEAVEQEFLTRNPAAKTVVPISATAPARPILTQEQINKLLTALTDPMDKAIFYIGTFCALRTSELFGLPWRNFYPPVGKEKRGYLMVDQTAFEGSISPAVKTRRSRAPVPVSDKTLAVILAWQAECPDPSPNALMFPSRKPNKKGEQGQPMWPGNWLTDHLQPVAKSVGIDFKVNFRATRRTASSTTQNNGVPLATSADFLRHGAGVAAGVYSISVPGSVVAAAQAYEDFLLPS